MRLTSAMEWTPDGVFCSRSDATGPAPLVASVRPISRHMTRHIKILAASLLLLLFGGLIGYILRVPGPASGGGQYQRSPDGKWVAFANTLADGSVLGPHRTYYEFMLQTPPPSPRTVRTLRLEDTVMPPIDWREEGSILWASNSSTVTFKSDVRQTRVEITLRVEP